MVRTQISLEEDEMETAQVTAKAYGISVAEMMRRALRKEFTPDKSKPWMKFCGSIESGSATSSQDIDELVYARKD